MVGRLIIISTYSDRQYAYIVHSNCFNKLCLPTDKKNLIGLFCNQIKKLNYLVVILFLGKQNDSHKSCLPLSYWLQMAV